MKRRVYCCGCEADVQARLTNGAEIYPHRHDLMNLPFWRCDECGNYVGCHHKTRDRTRPLGCIPTPEVRHARGAIHCILDPLWRRHGRNRTVLYRQIADALGVDEFHMADIRSVDEAKKVYRIVEGMVEESIW